MLIDFKLAIVFTNFTFFGKKMNQHMDVNYHCGDVNPREAFGLRSDAFKLRSNCVQLRSSCAKLCKYCAIFQVFK